MISDRPLFPRRLVLFSLFIVIVPLFSPVSGVFSSAIFYCSLLDSGKYSLLFLFSVLMSVPVSRIEPGFAFFCSFFYEKYTLDGIMVMEWVRDYFLEFLDLVELA